MKNKNLQKKLKQITESTLQNFKIDQIEYLPISRRPGHVAIRCRNVNCVSFLRQSDPLADQRLLPLNVHFAFVRLIYQTLDLIVQIKFTLLQRVAPFLTQNFQI
uniref:Uncharacterized protein n=1 Tax=Romanomermis culicivorax TaxID=13658 RepID=A0A915INW2_ROMCU